MSSSPTQPRDRTPREPGSVSPDAARNAPTPPPPDMPDAIGAWLDRLLRLIRLPSPEAAEIREELDAHLRERVRDLMLAGHDEPDAIHKSISELGDLALLAQRYREANRSPKGRIIMHAALFSAVAAALGLSTLAFQQSGSQPEVPSTPHAAQIQLEEGLALSLEPVIASDGSIDIISVVSRIAPRNGSAAGAGGHLLTRDAEGEELGAILGSMGEAADARIYIYWNHLEQYGLDREAMIDAMPFAGQTLEKALSMLSDTLGLRGGSRLAFRLDSGLMEIATVEFFDRQELELVGYDVGFLLDAESSLAQSTASLTLIELVTTLVEPGVWETNNGSATISAVGNQMFINAPKRVHDRVAWLLGELAKDTVSSHDPFAPAAPPASVRIEGAVTRPGSYQIPTAGELRLDQLLTAAGGIDSNATRIFVRQDNGDGQIIHMIDIGAMRTMADVQGITLSPWDSVFVAGD